MRHHCLKWDFFLHTDVVVFVSTRVSQRECNVESLLTCSPSPLHSGLSVVRDPTSGMLLDFTEVALKHISNYIVVMYINSV